MHEERVYNMHLGYLYINVMYFLYLWFEIVCDINRVCGDEVVCHSHHIVQVAYC